MINKETIVNAIQQKIATDQITRNQAETQEKLLKSQLANQERLIIAKQQEAVNQNEQIKQLELQKRITEFFNLKNIGKQIGLTNGLFALSELVHGSPVYELPFKPDVNYQLMYSFTVRSRMGRIWKDTGFTAKETGYEPAPHELMTGHTYEFTEPIVALSFPRKLSDKLSLNISYKSEDPQIITCNFAYLHYRYDTDDVSSGKLLSTLLLGAPGYYVADLYNGAFNEDKAASGVWPALLFIHLPIYGYEYPRTHIDPLEINVNKIDSKAVNNFFAAGYNLISK